ncbi:MAG: PP2C family protein-serine/threonine phosphatase [Planctomycetota bacterium]
MATDAIDIERLDRFARVRAALEMLREVSLATNEDELYAAFSKRFNELSGVTHALGLRVEGCEPGSFRVMLKQAFGDGDLTPECVRAMTRYWLPLDETPVVRSAHLSRLVEGESPKLVRGLDPAGDSVLEGWLPGPCDVLAVPVFSNGRVHEYSAMFMPPALRELDEEMLRIGIGNINFMSTSIETLVLKNEAERLHARLDAQMNEIGRVQRSLLPATWPTDPRFTFAVSYQPSEAAGGDYYDYRTFPRRRGSESAAGDDLLGVVIGDVSGHGPVASVVMSVFRTAMLATRLYTTDPARTVPDVNTMVCESVEPGMFVTAFLVTIDPATGEAIYACCGHNPPRLRRASGAVEAIEGCGGPPFGILPDLEPVGDAFVMHPGDTLVLYTDGITEAFSPGGELFGTHRLDAAIASAGTEPSAIRRAVLDAVAAHAGSRPRADDQTLVVVRYNGPDAGTTV